MQSPQRPPIVPMKYAGQWIAWNRQRTKIIGSGSTLKDVRNAVEEKGAVFVKAPKKNTRFIGTT